MKRALVPGLLAAAVVAAVFAALGTAACPGPPRAEGPVWRLHRGRLLYRYHASFRAEALFDLRADPLEARDLARERPADLERLRGTFLRALKARRLEDVPDSAAEWRRQLESLGYLGGGRR